MYQYWIVNSGWNKISPTESNDLDVELTRDGQRPNNVYACIYIYSKDCLLGSINRSML